MIRNCGIEEISDGRIYSENDMVRADTNNCIGCKTVCCKNMGNTIILDPYDVYRLMQETSLDFQSLINKHIELNVVDGIILPNLKMDVNNQNLCTFYKDNKCSIHKSRPGICRLFPLGRYWEKKDKFSYILQTGQCHKDNLTKIKVKKWIDTPDLNQYNEFVINWHVFIADLKDAVKSLDEENVKILTAYVLRTFYMTSYNSSDVYKEISDRIANARKTLAMD